MAQIVTMPKLGLTMTKGTVTMWLKQEGDVVSAGEPLCEIETDKITNQIESPVAGVLLKILAGEFEEREITAPLCVVGQIGEQWEVIAATGNQEAAIEQPSQAQPVATQETPAKRVLISPVAKRLAEENNIDYTEATGTGADGRIEKKDIERLLELGGKATEASSLGNQPNPGSSGEIAVGKRIPLSTSRKVSAARLAGSKHDIPHVYFKVTVDASGIMALKEKSTLAAAQGIGRKLTPNDIIAKATAVALAELPEVNATLLGDEILCYSDVNIGIAVNTGTGLVVPVIRNANRQGLQELSACASELIGRARAGKLTYRDITGGTFTISNLGSYGIDEFSAVINPPEAAILAVGSIADAPVAIGGGLFIRPMVCLTLSVDHRVIDGALAAGFLKRLKEILEGCANPGNVLE